jgi:hypothetical protein
MRFPKSRVAGLAVRLTYTHNHRCRLLADDVSTRHGQRFEATTNAAVPQLRHGHVSGRHHRAGRRCCGIARLRMPILLCWSDAIAARGTNQRGCCGFQRVALIGRRNPRPVQSRAATILLDFRCRLGRVIGLLRLEGRRRHRVPTSAPVGLTDRAASSGPD